MRSPDRRMRFSLLVQAAVLVAGFAAATNAGSQTASVGGPAPAKRGKKSREETVAVVKTPLGSIVFRFLDEAAPGHTAAVRDLIRRGFYDGTTFHRVIPSFVIQGGDPNSKDDDRSNDGDGEADRTLKAEFSKTLHYRPGTIGMARGDDPDSGSCQFFVALTDLPRLDGRYTIFGEVVEGLDVARRIAETPRDLNDNPLARVPMTVTLETRRLPVAILSEAAGAGSGELLTGPGKPRPFDPGNASWSAPKLRAGTVECEPGAADSPDPASVFSQEPASGAARAPRARSKCASDEDADPPPPVPGARLEFAVDEAGKVLDVRFPRLDTPSAEAVRKAALAQRFTPALLDGKPQKARFEMNADGSVFGPPTGGGAPIALAPGDVPPLPAVRVAVPAGTKVPDRPLTLRLTIDAAGKVTDASPQGTTGVPALDEAARKTALALAVTPAKRPPAPGKPPEPVASYLDLDATFFAGAP